MLAAASLSGRSSFSLIQFEPLAVYSFTPALKLLPRETPQWLTSLFQNSNLLWCFLYHLTPWKNSSFWNLPCLGIGNLYCFSESCSMVSCVCSPCPMFQFSPFIPTAASQLSYLSGSLEDDELESLRRSKVQRWRENLVPAFVAQNLSLYFQAEWSCVCKVSFSSLSGKVETILITIPTLWGGWEGSISYYMQKGLK